MGLPKKSGFNLHAKWPSGRRNLITDVKGVKVGHVTINKGDIHSGVTAVIPQPGNLFKNKVMAGVSVINGFGKSAGLIQIQEMGTIETPIILTNTLSVGTGAQALVRYMLKDNEDIGVTTGTVNPIVMECNDGGLSDIRGLHIKEKHIMDAINNCAITFEEGAVGGGTGMSCLGVKGGIGSASKVVKNSAGEFTIGALVMSNFGSPGNLVIGGKHYDTRKCSQAVTENEKKEEKKDKGSVIMIIATDAPLNERQLGRVSKRALAALARVGSYSGNSSGDIAVAFTTANRVPHYSKKLVLDTKMYFDTEIDELFEASVEAVEEALVSSLYHAKTMVGIRGKKKYGLLDFIKEFGE